MERRERMSALQSRSGMCGRLMNGVYRLDYVHDRLLSGRLDGAGRIDGSARTMQWRGNYRNPRHRRMTRLIRNRERQGLMIRGYAEVDESPDHQLLPRDVGQKNS